MCYPLLSLSLTLTLSYECTLYTQHTYTHARLSLQLYCLCLARLLHLDANHDGDMFPGNCPSTLEADDIISSNFRIMTGRAYLADAVHNVTYDSQAQHALYRKCDCVAMEQVPPVAGMEYLEQRIAI